MSWSWTLYRYLATQFLLGVATVCFSSPEIIRSVPPYFTSSDGTVGAVRALRSRHDAASIEPPGAPELVSL